MFRVSEREKIKSVLEQHRGTLVSTVASQQEEFESTTWLVPFCVDFVCV